MSQKHQFRTNSLRVIFVNQRRNKIETETGFFACRLGGSSVTNGALLGRRTGGWLSHPPDLSLLKSERDVVRENRCHPN
jgi:hypothetical protein